MKSKQSGSIRRAKRKLESLDIMISQGTVQTAIKKLGLRRVKLQKKPKLTEAQVAKRLEFAEVKRTKTFWRRVLFTDETMLVLEPPPSHVYISANNPIPIAPHSKYSPKIMVWGGISWYGKTGLFLVTKGESVNSDRYQEVLEEAWPTLPFPSSVDWIFQQDGAKCHTSRSTLQYLEEDKKAEVLPDWPANSPDLNCIENLWYTFKERVYRRNFKTVDGLFRVAQDEWNKIELSEIQKLISSMPNRLRQVVERQGRHSDY